MTAPPLADGLGALAGKRFASLLSYYAGGRGRHFAGVDDRIVALLRDVEQLNVDHALCTGDLTQVGSERELGRARELFGRLAERPEALTVLPGNHDRYTPGTAGRLEAHFPAVAPGAFPFVKDLGPRVRLIALDAARPTSAWDSSGRLGPTQLGALAERLTEAPPEVFVIVALHYGLFRHTGRPDRPSHGLRDLEGLRAVLTRGRRPDLVVHGHIHRAYSVVVDRVPVYCAGSATDLARTPGYFVYEIDAATRRLDVRRREWDAVAGRYREGRAESLPRGVVGG